MKTNTDGEFGETAGAWLDGTGDEGTRRVLAAQLRDPERVEEFAGLCRTEALLHAAGRTEAERRAALGAMVGRSWWRGRAREWVRRPVVWRVAAALAVCGLLGWAMWPEEGAGVAGRLVGKRPAVVASPIGQGGAVKAEAVREMGEGMERELRSRYLLVPMHWPLEQAAVLLSRALALPGGKVPEVEVRDEGDAQVMLNLPVGLPAWTLLEMMAVQTGTEFRMEGDVLVFEKAEKARGDGGKAEDELVLPGGSLEDLALLLTGKPLRSGDPEELNARLATRGTHPIGGGPLQVGRVGESLTVSGPVRTLRALEIGLRGMRERALVLSVEVSILRVGKETPLPEGGPGWVAGGGEGEDASGLKVQVTLGAAEYGKAMEKLAGEPGVTTLAAPGMVVRLFQTAMMTVGGRRVAMLAVPLGHDRVVLHAGMDSGEVGGPELPAYEVAVWLGSGMGGLLRREVDDGVECVGMVPKLKDASWEEPVFELPRGTVAEKPGMVHSPYAAGAGMVDVQGLKSGTKVRCPYSGLNFVVP